MLSKAERDARRAALLAHVGSVALDACRCWAQKPDEDKDKKAEPLLHYQKHPVPQPSPQQQPARQPSPLPPPQQQHPLAVVVPPGQQQQQQQPLAMPMPAPPALQPAHQLKQPPQQQQLAMLLPPVQQHDQQQQKHPPGLPVPSPPAQLQQLQQQPLAMPAALPAEDQPQQQQQQQHPSPAQHPMQHEQQLQLRDVAAMVLLPRQTPLEAALTPKPPTRSRDIAAGENVRPGVHFAAAGQDAAREAAHTPLQTIRQLQFTVRRLAPVSRDVTGDEALQDQTERMPLQHQLQMPLQPQQQHHMPMQLQPPPPQQHQQFFRTYAIQLSASAGNYGNLQQFLRDQLGTGVSVRGSRGFVYATKREPVAEAGLQQVMAACPRGPFTSDDEELQTMLDGVVRFMPSLLVGWSPYSRLLEGQHPLFAFDYHPPCTLTTKENLSLGTSRLYVRQELNEEGKPLPVDTSHFSAMLLKHPKAALAGAGDAATKAMEEGFLDRQCGMNWHLGTKKMSGGLPVWDEVMWTAF